MKIVPDSIQKPRRTAAESKQETTTRVVREILDGEAAKREAKTARLRELRLANEKKQAAMPAVATARKPSANRKAAR